MKLNKRKAEHVWWFARWICVAQEWIEGMGQGIEKSTDKVELLSDDKTEQKKGKPKINE